MQTRFIADLHFYDAYSFDWRKSDLDTFVNMIQDNWNKVVAPDDLTIVVGDIGHYCPKTVEALKQLSGKKVLVIGNHDAEWGNNLWSSNIFQGIYQTLEYKGLYVEHIPDETTIKT